ncbi:unnamed protein product [Xylocopa violacea]|uniref:Essential protein Yae1 N-terminal domain-containing protein n=1 Tax=Xylocopa violacea TaxID=135666 RepID=A0ABP1PAT5_XYLVO
MDNVLNELDGEDSLDLASKEWNHVMDTAKKSGYREGVIDGENSVFQEGFDIGYKEGFQTAFLLGKFKSLLNTISQDEKHPQNIKEILNKTRKGICHICMTESESVNNKQKSFSEIINEQRTHSINVLDTLYQYFQPYVKQINIEELDKLKTESHFSKGLKDD